MAYDAALALANQMWQAMTSLAGDIVRACDDGSVGPFEILEITLDAAAFGQTLASLIVQGTPQTRQDLLYVSEHAVLVLPEAPQAGVA